VHSTPAAIKLNYPNAGEPPTYIKSRIPPNGVNVGALKTFAINLMDLQDVKL
jgi:hypothetical protein